MWDYKWTALDRGNGYNFQIIEPGSAAFSIHNVIRHFEEESSAFQDIESVNCVLNVGCGIGQYSVTTHIRRILLRRQMTATS